MMKYPQIADIPYMLYRIQHQLPQCSIKKMHSIGFHIYYQNSTSAHLTTLHNEGILETGAAITFLVVGMPIHQYFWQAYAFYSICLWQMSC